MKTRDDKPDDRDAESKDGASVNDSLEILETFLNESEADIVKGFLETNGIPAYIFRDDPVHQFSLGLKAPRVKLMVSSSDLPKARELLKNT